MTKYLVTYYQEDGTFCYELCTMDKIANLIGFRDCSGAYEFRVWRVLHDNVVPLVVKDYHRELTVALYDRFDNFVAEATYSDH